MCYVKQACDLTENHLTTHAACPHNVTRCGMTSELNSTH